MKSNIIKYICAVVIIVSLVIIVTTVLNNSITANEFNQIQYDMTYEEVCEIVGYPGEYGSGASFGEYSSEIYTFRGVLYHLNGANAVISFSNGRVSAMACTGLI